MAATSSCLREFLQPRFLETLSHSDETPSLKWFHKPVKQHLPSHSVPYLPQSRSIHAAALVESDFPLHLLSALNSRRLASVICKATVSGRQESGQSRATAKGGPEEGPVTPFHLAFPVNDLEATREFYGR